MHRGPGGIAVRSSLPILTLEGDGLVHQEGRGQGDVRAEHLVLPVVRSALQSQHVTLGRGHHHGGVELGRHALAGAHVVVDSRLGRVGLLALGQGAARPLVRLRVGVGGCKDSDSVAVRGYSVWFCRRLVSEGARTTSVWHN